MNILIFPVILTCISLTYGNNWIRRQRNSFTISRIDMISKWCWDPYTKKYLRRYFPVRRLTCIPGYEGENCATQCFSCQGYRELQKKVTYLENNRPVIIPDNNGGSGTKGQRGEKGDRGDRGLTGQKGNQGVLGFTGFKGDAGGKGDKGDTGDMGLKGERGLKGESGTGNNDVVGLPGQKGEPGITGPSGPPGITGQKGDVGQSGINGLPGKKGEPGMNGLNGFPGTNGEDGLPGPRGLPGSDGERGYPGIPGNPGLKGSTGEPGLDGPPGISGVPGAKGETGETTTIVIPNEEITILKEKIKDLENTVTSCCDEVKELSIIVTGILKSMTTTTTTETVTQPSYITTVTLPVTTPLTVCEPSEIKCVSSDRCIPSEFRCDGIGDCDDESDEIGCKCNRFQFTCVSDQRCIPLDKKCNNDFDCKDMSDEVGCEEIAGCPEGLFTCDNRNCIRQALKCNGVDDCGDESDEMLDGCDNVNETDKSAALKRTGCNSIDCSEPPSYPFNIPGCKTINCSLPPPPLPPIEHPLRDDVMNIISSSDCKDDALSLFGLQQEHGVSINSQLKDDRSLMKMFISGKDATSMGISQTIMSGTLVFKILQFVLICMCITYPIGGVF